MRCCGNCFQDHGLSHEIIPGLSTTTGTCPTCGGVEQKLVEATLLGEYFELLCGIYVASPDGKVLVDWLMEDWEVFAIQREVANALLVEILDDGERVRQHFKPSERCDTDRLTRWEELRQELRHTNRFFPKTDFAHDRLEELLPHLLFTIDDAGSIWHRARIQKSSSPFLPEQMGAPPESIASHGRANPAGIPYLYLGSEPATAVAEVRPHPGESVYVAEFVLPTGLEVIDLRNPRRTVSPFLLVDDDDIALMRGDIHFLERLGMELTTPVLPNAAAIDYIPSQYLCEFIKKCEHKGVLYSSSIGDGVNLALFDPNVARVGSLTVFDIESVEIRMSKKRR